MIIASSYIDTEEDNNNIVCNNELINDGFIDSEDEKDIYNDGFIDDE